MQNRVSTVLGSVAALFLAAIPVSAQGNGVVPFVNAKGTLVFSNYLVDHTPAPVKPVIQEPMDPLAKQIPQEYRPLVEEISGRHGVDPGLVRAVMKTESNFDRWAVSHKGARGLMQLIPATARRFGVLDSFDPAQNIEGGVRYLKFLLEKFNGDLDLSLAAYNAGENLVARLGRIPPIKETTNYVKKVRAHYKRPAAVLPNPAAVVASAESPKAEPAREDTRRIYTWVDSRGVTHFSNIGPPN